MNDFPVREGTLEAAWDMTAVGEHPRRVILVVTLRARPGMEASLEAAAREFVAATLRLPGNIGSDLIQGRDAMYLLERFDGEESFGRHMASDYFARFQVEQRPLLEEPAQAYFLERG